MERCPYCFKGISIKFTPHRLYSSDFPEVMETEKEFDLGCPNCHKPIRISVKLFTKAEERKDKKEKERRYTNEINNVCAEFVEKVKQGIDPSTEQCEKTTDQIVYDYPENIDFVNSSICFTGNFANEEMTRKELEGAVQYLGATVLHGVKKDLDILVVGSVPSAQWVGGNYGGKILDAISKRAFYQKPLIVSEEHFLLLFRKEAEKIKNPPNN